MPLPLFNHNHYQKNYIDTAVPLYNYYVYNSHAFIGISLNNPLIYVVFVKFICSSICLSACHPICILKTHQVIVIF